MPTASVVLLATSLVLVAVLVSALWVVSRALLRTARSVEEMGDRLVGAEQRVQDLQARLVAVTEDVDEVATRVTERPSSRSEAPVHRG